MHIRHVGIVTQNIHAEKAFYEGKGFQCIYNRMENVHIVKLQKDGDVIELLQYESMSENNLRKLGISHIAFTTDPDGNYLELVEKQNAVGQ